MFRSILVPLDGSAFGEHALPLAASLARKDGAALHLVHVHQPVPPVTLGGVAIPDTVDLHLRQDEEAYLADVSLRLNQLTFLPQQTALLDGDVVPALREYVERNNVGLVVMSTHGRGAMGRFWLGGIADEMVREMPRPVLLVRPPEGKCNFRRLPELKSILLPLDGTALAEQAIEPALALGRLFDATYTLVRVNKPVIRPTYLPEGTSTSALAHGVLEQIEGLHRQAKKEAKGYLDGVAAKLAARGFTVDTQVIIDEKPAAGILAEARARHADLIAMETHGRRGLSRLLLGSVADKVVRGSVIPVLLSRPAK
jgi:nucleotide-binding universal stress UspA family protein